MIVWGGCGLATSTTARSTAAAATTRSRTHGRATATAGAPSARIDHTAVWTGTQMIVWGGCRFVNDACSATALGNSGGRYDPGDELAGRPRARPGAPAARHGAHRGVDRLEMIVWGGAGAAVYAERRPVRPRGERLDAHGASSAERGRGTSTPPCGPDSQMIVWGGNNATTYFNNGASLLPAAEPWRQRSTVNAPAGRSAHTAVWTGTQMIVWGGCNGRGLICGTPAQHRRPLQPGRPTPGPRPPRRARPVARSGPRGRVDGFDS